MTENEISALIRLLDDPDKNVFSAVEKKIIDEGESMISALEQAWADNESNSLLQKRIEKIVPTLESNAMLEKFRDWGNNPGNLMHGAWLVSRLQNFSLSLDDFTGQYNELKEQLYKYGFSNYSPIEHIKIMNYIFFRKMGFKPCKPENFANPNTCFPSCVMNTKEGNPESLALLYLLFAQEAGLPLRGVNLPKNFILSYHDSDFGTRFYINPTTTGAIFHKQEIDSFLDQLKLQKEGQFYSPCSNVILIKRLLMRLAFSYRENRQDKQADNVTRMINSLPEKLDRKIDWV